MLSLLVYLSLLTENIRIESGAATVYHPGDGNCGKVKADGSTFKKSDSHIANRRIPLRTRGILCNLRTGRCTQTIVRDRGPFGTVIPCSEFKKDNRSRYPLKQIRWKGKCHYWQVQIKLLKGWQRRGNFDITIPIARKLRHRAFDKVVFIYNKKRRRQ